LVFFSISKSKLPGYILPAVPAICTLFSHSYVHLVPRAEKAFQKLILLFTFSSIPLFLLLLGFGSSLPFHWVNEAAAASVGWTLLLFTVANLLLAYRRDATSQTISINPFCLVPILVLVLMFPQISAPWLSYDHSGKTLARELVENRIPLDQLYISKMNRGQEYSLNFYVHRKLETWSKETPKDSYLIYVPVTPDHYENFRGLPWACSEQSKILLRVSGWHVCRLERAFASE
jgi:4-amino-4-deoxy-L-arabinose transferase-like glycosyltransferase